MAMTRNGLTKCAISLEFQEEEELKSEEYRVADIIQGVEQRFVHTMTLGMVAKKSTTLIRLLLYQRATLMNANFTSPPKQPPPTYIF